MPHWQISTICAKDFLRFIALLLPLAHRKNFSPWYGIISCRGDRRRRICEKSAKTASPREGRKSFTQVHGRSRSQIPGSQSRSILQVMVKRILCFTFRNRLVPTLVNPERLSNANFFFPNAVLVISNNQTRMQEPRLAIVWKARSKRNPSISQCCLKIV